MKYKGFDLDKYVNGPHSDNGFKPPKFLYEKIDISEEPENPIIKNLLWSAKFYIIGVIILHVLLGIILLICALVNS